MNGLRCPNCELVNLLTAKSCHRCGTALSDLPDTAQVSVPVEELAQARGFSSGGSTGIPEDNELGAKTYFWYRVYCMVMVALYVMVMALGVILAVVQPESDTGSAEESLIMGLAYAIVGAIFAVVYAVALFLPRKPFNWIVGIVMLAIGMTSCCFIPAALPLLIFWIKPETQAYFGRT